MDFIGFRNTTGIFFGLYCLMLLIDTIESAKYIARERRLAMYEDID